MAAFEVLREISMDKAERARLENEYNETQLYLQSKKAHARQQGFEEGRQEGEKMIIDLLKSGKPPEKIIREYGGD